MDELKNTDNNQLVKSEFIGINPDTMHPDVAWEKMKDRIEKIDVQPLQLDTPIFSDKVRFVCMSDTHCQTGLITSQVNIPNGDVFIHAGDFTTRGRISEIEEFNKFLKSINKKFKYKIVIAGNHELLFDENNTQLLRNKYDVKNDSNIKDVRELLTSCHYLENNGITLFGLNIYGSPVTSTPHWAFDVTRGEEISKIWNKIPNNIDVLITHGPPIGFGDKVIRKDGTTTRVGCCELLSTIQKRVKPKYHIFGHIHEDYGMWTDKQTFYINASNFNRGKVQPPVIFDIDLPEGYSK